MNIRIRFKWMWEKVATSNFEIEPSLPSAGSSDNCPGEVPVSLGADIARESQMDISRAKLQTEITMLGLMEGL